MENYWTNGEIEENHGKEAQKNWTTLLRKIGNHRIDSEKEETHSYARIGTTGQEENRQLHKNEKLTGRRKRFYAIKLLNIGNG